MSYCCVIFLKGCALPSSLLFHFHLFLLRPLAFQDGPHLGECVFLEINPLLRYHLVSCWILSVMRHQEPELHYILRPGVWSSSKDHGFRSQAELHDFSSSQSIRVLASENNCWDFLVAQWLRHHDLNAGGLGFPGEGTKRHMLQLRVGMPL